MYSTNSLFEKIREIGEEYGATTGRKRQVNWLDLNFLKKAIHINGVTHLVINKMDILQKVEKWTLYKNGMKINFENENSFKEVLTENTVLDNRGIRLHQILFSSHKDKI